MRFRSSLLSGIVLVVALGGTSATASPDRQVILVLVPVRSYEQLLSDPVVRDLAQAGGIGLMTSSGGTAEASMTAVSVGAGASAEDAPAGPVPWSPEDEGIRVDVDPYVTAAGDATPGLTGTALAERDLTVGYLGSAGDEVSMLAAMDREGVIPLTVQDPRVASLEAMEALVGEVVVLVGSDVDLVPSALEVTGADDVLVIVAGAGASPAMRDAGDTVAPIVVARGSPRELLRGEGLPAGLTSDTTRREGLVADVDVAPTILGFLGVEVPDDMGGAPIRTAGAPPTDLHERYLDHQRVVGPIGQVLVWFAVASLVAGLAVVFVLRRPRTAVAGATALAELASIALMVAMVPASVVRPSGPAVVLGLALVAGVVVAVAVRLGRRDARLAVTAVAVAGLLALLVDRMLGWPSLLTPLLGGGALDGERFYGLGNAYAGFVLAGTVLWASRLRTGRGVALIGAGAFFAGLPCLGADLGGSITLAIAAALWFGLRRWRGLGWRTWALAVAAGLAALVLFTVADRVLPAGGTHLSGVSEGSGGLLGQVEVGVERLVGNVRTTSQTPAAWFAVLGLPLWLAAAVRRPERLEPTLGPDERWRDAVIVLALGGIVGYLVNDTQGMAGVTFAFLSTAMLYPTLMALSRRARAPVTRERAPAA